MFNCIVILNNNFLISTINRFLVLKKVFYGNWKIICIFYFIVIIYALLIIMKAQGIGVQVESGQFYIDRKERKNKKTTKYGKQRKTAGYCNSLFNIVHDKG